MDDVVEMDKESDYRERVLTFLYELLNEEQGDVKLRIKAAELLAKLSQQFAPDDLNEKCLLVKVEYADRGGDKNP